MKMQRLQLIKKILAINVCLFTTFVYANDIGDITEHNGSSGIVRDTGETLAGGIGEDIFFKDSIETAQGRMNIKFIDETNLKLTEHTEVVIDEYYFDPDPSKSKMAMKFVSGTARFTTGKLGLVPRENIVITTPTATIGVRGTSFTTSVDELGRSLVILLPETECTIDGDCSPSGEITVTNEGGVVVLNEAFQATMVSSISTPPIQPVVLDNILNLDSIDNMFIVTPPKAVQDASNEEAEAREDSSDSLLDFNDLDIDYLAEDYLDNDSLEFTELDINYLDVNFLEDLLNVLDALAIDEDEDVLAQATSTQIAGTLLGKDPDTQITALITGNVVSLRRQVNESVRVDLDGSNAYTVILIQDGVSNIIKINGGSDSVITITQSN